jgi:hypothetical protein
MAINNIESIDEDHPRRNIPFILDRSDVHDTKAYHTSYVEIPLCSKQEDKKSSFPSRYQLRHNQLTYAAKYTWKDQFKRGAGFII